MGFRVVVAGGPAAPAAARRHGFAGTGREHDPGHLPGDYGNFPEDAPPLTCGCSAAAVKEGSVRGANPYYYQSSLCHAALHAGAIGAGRPNQGRAQKTEFFPAVTRNSVAAGSWGEGMGFSVVVAGGSPAQAPAARRRRRRQAPA